MTKHGANKHKKEILALLNGETIQYKSKATEEWEDCYDPSFIEAYEYRVKPKVVECWANVYNNGSFAFHDTESAAKSHATSNAMRVAVKLVEA